MADAWYKALWHLFDGLLRSVSETLQSIVRGLRWARFVLILLIVFVTATAVFTVLRPEYAHYILAGVLVVLMLPLMAMLALVMLPFRAKSAIRLIDQGYPKNVKELTIRAAARKLHDESIESEKLLLETAVHEGRKAVRKYRAQLERFKRELDAMEDAIEDDLDGAPPRAPGDPPSRRPDDDRVGP